MNNPVAELLAEPDKGVSRAKGTLSHLFRQALLWNKIGNHNWRKRAKHMLERPHNAHLKKDMGNLNKDLVRDDFSWPNFKKAVDFLHPESAYLRVILEWRNGCESTYTIVIDPAENETDIIDRDPSDDNVLFKGKKPPASSLTRLWRLIIEGENMTEERWEALMDTYINDSISTIDMSSQKRNDAVSQLTRQLGSGRMTWNSLKKGINILDPTRVTYQLVLNWPPGIDAPTTYDSIVRNPKDIVYDPTEKPKKAHR